VETYPAGLHSNSSHRRFQKLRRIMVMQCLSNQTRIPATIVEYRHPVPVSSALEAQR
jgi:hypothetical protein